MLHPPFCLSIAGSDSGGLAGIQMDLKVFASLQVLGGSVVTAITAQSPTKVSSIYPIPVSVIRDQYQTVVQAYPIKAAKVGMVYTPEIICAIAEILEQNSHSFPVVIDPVWKTTSGYPLTIGDSKSACKKFLFPCATLLTPNIPEAEYYSERTFCTEEDIINTAIFLSREYHTNILLKGGHGNQKNALDYLVKGKEIYSLSLPRLKLSSSSGTGCMLSSAITAYLALGKDIIDAVILAKYFVWNQLQEDSYPNIGGGYLTTFFSQEPSCTVEVTRI